MWLRAVPRMPYYDDPDYRASVVASIKQRFGNVPVDVTLFEAFGIFDVQLDRQLESELSALPLIGRVYPAVDREMTLGSRTVI